MTASQHAKAASLPVRSWTRACAALIAGVVALTVATAAHGASRIKDVVTFEGIRDNVLVGYGLVVGLNGTGDNLSDGHFTKQSLLAMLNRLGVKPTEDGLASDNVAAVMVTANLPGFARQGTRIDVTVSALGDAESLLGGTLVVTPAARRPTARSMPSPQGQLAVGGFSAGGDRPDGDQGRADQRPHRQRGDRRARGRFRDGVDGHRQAEPAQPRPDDGPPDRPGRQRLPRHRPRRPPQTPRQSGSRCRNTTATRSSIC